jgi:hypothetical protein
MKEGKVFTLPQLSLHIFSHDCAHVENIKSRNKFPSFFFSEWCCVLKEEGVKREKIDIVWEVDEDENDEATGNTTQQQQQAEASLTRQESKQT